jgi:hypothetical protein
MIETISVLESLDEDISQIIYHEVALRRQKFLDYIFSKKDINKFLVDKNKQHGLI